LTANQRLLACALERVQQRLEQARAHATHGALSGLEQELEAVRTNLSQVELVLRVEVELNQLSLWGGRCST
jgi:hypothetical protein